MNIRYAALFALAVVILAMVWYAWHVATVDLPLVTAPPTLIELPPPTLTSRPIAVWIDTDAACGTGKRRDVDDCWAIAATLRNPELAVRGITTVFGNTDAQTAATVAASVSQHFGHRLTPTVGADRAGQHATAAVETLAQALRREPLLILSLGPATNVAATVRLHPDVKSRIMGVVAVAGASDTTYFEVGDSRVFHAHDQNFRRDVKAFETLLNARIPLLLVPYDTVSKIVITSSDLQRLAQTESGSGWLAQESRDWLEHWSKLSGTDGFVPFDAVAAASVILPTAFHVTRRTVQIRRSVSHAPEQFLVASPGFSRGWVVSYAIDATPATKDVILSNVSNSRP